MASTKYETDIELEQLTGIRERRVVGEGEDSYTLALGAARDALAHADCAAGDLDMLLVSSISRHVGGLRVQLEPPVSVALKAALGAGRAISLDISNACAGMMTGVFISTTWFGRAGSGAGWSSAASTSQSWGATPHRRSAR